MRLANDLPEHFEYFQQRDDARDKPGFTATQKITAALRQLAYGVGSDMLDEYLQMAKKTGRDALNHFCRGCSVALIVCMLVGLCVSLLGEVNSIESPIIDDLIDRIEPPQAFYANGEHFKYGYYLVDGVYNEWGILVQAYASPFSDKRKYFSNKQESARKDIERAFGVPKEKMGNVGESNKILDKEEDNGSRHHVYNPT
ncbi:uncharacterized protein LOC143545874 [Bidens hawaiensis]|uniref:uncharacterized protein LOC143545874 n=1 Tax=Bidens hawaiensis TaxID=980011 RepID=UPI0040490CA1